MRCRRSAASDHKVSTPTTRGRAYWHDLAVEIGSDDEVFDDPAYFGGRMPALADNETDGCFLCQPDPSLVHTTSDSFYAMFALGPLRLGYSLIAAREHVPSMFDLDPAAAEELARFTVAVRRRLWPLFGRVVVTEHGRVPPCLNAFVHTHEPHCLHAHRLVFTGVSEMRLGSAALGVRRFASYADARKKFRDRGQYLYLEGPDGNCELTSVSGPITRQFFRRLAAAMLGEPELADWRAHPREELMWAAARRLA